MERRSAGSFQALLALNFWLWFAGYQVFPVVPLHLRHLGASLAESGRFAAFLTVGTALGALLLGRVGDRVGPGRLFRFSAAGLCCLLIGYGFLERPGAILGLAPGHGLLWAGLKTSAMAMATELLPVERRAAGLSWFGLSGALGVALGPLLGLQALPWIGFRRQIILTGVVFAVLALSPGLGALRTKAQPTHEGPWPGWRIQLPAALIFAWGWAQGLLPPFSAQEARWLHMAWPSALLTCFAIGMLASRSAFGFLGQGFPPLRLMPFLILGGLGALALLGVLPGALLRHVLGGATFGACLGLAHTLLFAEASARCGPRRTETVGLMYLAYETGMGLGAGLVGQAMERFARAWGDGLAFRAGWLMGGVCLLLALPFAWKAQSATSKVQDVPTPSA